MPILWAVHYGIVFVTLSGECAFDEIRATMADAYTDPRVPARAPLLIDGRSSLVDLSPQELQLRRRGRRREPASGGDRARSRDVETCFGLPRSSYVPFPASRPRGGDPDPYVPQRTFLSLLNTADGKALLRWHGVVSHSRWAWWLKDRIDRRFVSRYPRPRESRSRRPRQPRAEAAGASSAVG